MNDILAAGIAFTVLVYLALQLALHATQHKAEPRLLEFMIPFLDSVIGVFKYRARYLVHLRGRYHVPIHTLRMPFQRLYVVHAPHLVQAIQSKANANIFIPNLLDFGMLFSGLTHDSQKTLRKAFGLKGNVFTMSVHKYLLSGPSLNIATKAAVDRLSANLPNKYANFSGGLLELLRHELTLAMTGAIYGPDNPYDDPQTESSWCNFIPGINHLLYSPFPYLTARKALQARSRVIDAFKKYFKHGSHLQAFPMVSEMFESNKCHGLVPDEAAKMEMATSLAMLSSGSNTTFWLLLQIMSNKLALKDIYQELQEISQDDTADNRPNQKILYLNQLKTHCPTLMAMLNETLRYHSTVINIKQVQRDTTLADHYMLRKNAVIMIPGQSIHHNKEIWGPHADVFDHLRFISSDNKKKLSTPSAFRPFGSGATMCPGRHFSTNVILSLVAMVVLQYNVVPAEGQWRTPTKRHADMWNAMPKPDRDVHVNLVKKSDGTNVEWKFVWADGDA